MNELVFQVEFISDIVLPATSNTEGNIEPLDFIPGSNFLGMAAREYGTFSNSFSVFHSGVVRFGDATLVSDNQTSYKMPLSFFHEKLDDSQMVNHHLIEDFSKYKQLKQKRKGYITKDFLEIGIKYNYAQKSAYDKENRHSKEGTMYGYKSIPSGTLWQFVLKYDDTIKSEDVEKIEKALVGKRRLGKSKSSQYGRVYISRSEKAEEVSCLPTNDGHVLLYAKSRLALVDEEGLPSYDLKYLTEGLSEENIVWEKSQIKTSTFTPYNSTMQTKSYERVVINSGSVIALQNLSSEQVNSLEQSVGVYLNEGFGEVLVNPAFLFKEGEFSLADGRETNGTSNIGVKDEMVQFLKKREDEKLQMITLASKVNRFARENKRLYKNISNAQWGTIRSICSSGRENFREEIRKYIESGKVTWTNEQIETLLEEGKSREFIKLLSMQMLKVKEEK